LARIALLPLRLRLAYAVDAFGMGSIIAWLCAAFALGATFLSLVSIKKNASLVSLGILSFSLFCLPFLQWVPFRTFSYASERFLFLPLIGFALAIAAWLMAQRPWVRFGLSLFLWGLFILGTSHRTLAWRTPERLVHNSTSTVWSIPNKRIPPVHSGSPLVINE
jgi:hypothetical protein